MSSPITCEVEVEVRYAETDQMGVVHHANYLVWFELARTRLCDQAGLHYAEIERGGHFLMVTGAELSYRRGARYGDRVRIECSMESLVSRGASFVYRVLRGDELLADGRTRHVWVDRAASRPCRMPESARPYFERMAGRNG